MNAFSIWKRPGKVNIKEITSQVQIPILAQYGYIPYFYLLNAPG
ncbi:hypothetical protein C723_3026 [Christiangramia flava JLT2011]|uniref:Uncharacterized protein n=1 Tax=Christiangramia flava JLT2011 TaxID=1229726 RepID=A0A1L7I0K2_9FLAO|nr:hypothetical protein GRFL_0377 [Christiangramia flava JLT2011]OSS38127.1 hypothetical protein C723_3026 [Christiangramia flava JLT2011]